MGDRVAVVSVGECTIYMRMAVYVTCRCRHTQRHIISRFMHITNYP